MKKNNHAIPLESLPPALRAQAEAQLSIAKECPHPTSTNQATIIQNTPPKKPKQTKTELLFRDIYLRGKEARFEAITLILPGGSRYTPDWCIIEGTTLTLYEVKGSYNLHSHSRALTAFREARAAFPCFTFRWFQKTGTTTFIEKYHH
jgi:hypothetical protein